MARMAMAAAAAALVAACCLAGALGNDACDPTYECNFQTRMNDTDFKWDFAELCSNQDYVVQDDQGHSYYANICGYANQNCLPATWTNTYEYGVTVQMWGGDPPHTSMECQHKNGVPAYCTKDCQVLGVGAPSWALSDFDNPYTGGIEATFAGAQPSTDDPFFCPFDPVTGQQEERKVTFRLLCDYDVVIEPVRAYQNSSENCHYQVDFSTMYACANNLPSPGGAGPDHGGGISAGWVLIIIGLVAVLIYVGGGVAFSYATAKQVTHPHAEFWVREFPALVTDGAAFAARGFRRRPGSYAHHTGSASGIGSDGATAPDGAGESYQGDKEVPDAYTDL